MYRVLCGVRPCVVAGCLAFAAAAGADPRDDLARGAPGQAASSGAASWPLNVFGLDRLARSLESSDPAERSSAIQRLAGLGTEAAVHRLTSFALAHRADLGAREWLALVRGLAPSAARADSEVVLAVVLNLEPDPAQKAPSGLLELARGSAALALAACHSEAALAALGSALHARGAPAAAAAEALRSHPPPDLDRLLAAPGEPSVELARLLGDLGDERAFHPLRAWVRGAASAEVRAAAALALTELGGLETAQLARQWLGSNLSVLRRAALRILSLTRAADIGALLDRELAPELSGTALARDADEFLLASLPTESLSRLASRAPEAPVVWSLLEQHGGDAAAQRLEAALGHPESALGAARALARWPGSAGHGVIERLLKRGVALPLVVRVAALRRALWQEDFPALPERSAALLASDSPRDRAAGAWARSLESPAAALGEVASNDLVRREAAANNGLWFDASVAEKAAVLLGRAAAGPARTALAFALIRPSGRRAVTSLVLRELVLEGGLAAPLALRVLASRSEPEFTAFAAAFARHPDPLLRAHLARGLGESERPAALGLLARSYELETDARVREAIVRALSGHAGRAAQTTLELAARLDPSPPVRSAARLALAGQSLADPPAGRDSWWAEAPARGALPATKGTVAQGAGAATGLMEVQPGLALPVFADEGGIAVLAGVDAAARELRWSPGSKPAGRAGEGAAASPAAGSPANPEP